MPPGQGDLFTSRDRVFLMKDGVTHFCYWIDRIQGCRVPGPGIKPILVGFWPERLLVECSLFIIDNARRCWVWLSNSSKLIYSFHEINKVK